MKRREEPQERSVARFLKEGGDENIVPEEGV
jgi:hypothetical protein